MSLAVLVPAVLLLLGGCSEDAAPDAGTTDAGTVDAGVDAAEPDSGSDAGADGGPPDATLGDAGLPGRFTLAFTVRPNATVDAFDLLEGLEATCEVAFPFATESGDPPRIEHRSPAVSVACEPDPPDVVTRLGTSLTGEPATFVVFGTASSPTNVLRLEIVGSAGSEAFRILADCEASAFPDDGARPVLGPFECAGGTLSLERYAGGVSPTTLTDRVIASATLRYLAP